MAKRVRRPRATVDIVTAVLPISPQPPWQQTVLRPPPWPPLLIAARWWVRYGPGITIKQRLLRKWLDIGLQQKPRPSATVRTRYGQRFLVPTTNDFIARAIYTHGCWEACISALVASRLQRGDGFIDVGSAGGWYAVLAARLVGPTGYVVAIEPAAHEHLRANLALNRVGNVRVVQAAVTGEPETVTLYTPHANTGATTTIRPDTYQSTVTVPGLPLAQMLHPGDLENARIIKVDVEGAEGTVLTQLAASIPRLRTDCEIIVEVTPYWLATTGHDASELLKPFMDNGFHPYRIQNSYAPEDIPGMLRRSLPPSPATGPFPRQIDLLLTRATEG
ncbi:FkbM family methyltransferase [Nocardia sp. NPDC057455]|uniref:FkbM family methyltransferase n=1 Tax=Nocardia sp. NPDC057455 TaxID=3346138 RepID=UPI003673072D